LPEPNRHLSSSHIYKGIVIFICGGLLLRLFISNFSTVDDVRMTAHMEKRISGRIPIRIEIHCCNVHYFGTITNISANGMYIKSKQISFPLASQFEICIPLNGNELKVHVKISRITKSNGYYDGMGVEILNPSRNYFDFINCLPA
jgi:hypothetical protein